MNYVCHEIIDTLKKRDMSYEDLVFPTTAIHYQMRQTLVSLLRNHRRMPFDAISNHIGIDHAEIKAILESA